MLMQKHVAMCKGHGLDSNPTSTKVYQVGVEVQPQFSPLDRVQEMSL